MKPDHPDYSRSKAILIGTSVYRDKCFLPLPAAANSLKGLQEILLDEQLCGWPAASVSAQLNPADPRRILTDLRRWARDTEDVLLVYYVGHGTITPDGELCLALSDTEFDEPDITGIEYRRVRSALIDSPARIKVVILDCCYSGRAIQALSSAEEIADLTDIRGAYTITASDHAAHVPPPPQQTRACTSFTGELLDLIRTGIPGGPESLTLTMIYAHLRRRLRKAQLPAPNQRGTDTAGDFVFTRNAALLPYPIERFPRPQPSMMRRALKQPALVAAAIAATTTALATFALLGAGVIGPRSGILSCPASTGTTPRGDVVVGATTSPEDVLLGQIYTDALQAKGITVVDDFGSSSREVSFPEVCEGQVTIMPEYNGALLTTSVDPGSKAFTTGQVDAALEAGLPHSLMILDPSQAQDQDTLTVTRATASRYHLASITDLRRVAATLTIGAPPEFLSRQQGVVGLQAAYGLEFSRFQPLDESGLKSVPELTSGQVQVADVFSTDPLMTLDHLVWLTDPRHVFTAENIVPLVYKAGVNATVINTLNAVSAKLTQGDLLSMDQEVMYYRDSTTDVAARWLAQVGLSS